MLRRAGKRFHEELASLYLFFKKEKKPFKERHDVFSRVILLVKSVALCQHTRTPAGIKPVSGFVDIILPSTSLAENQPTNKTFILSML